MEGVDRLLRAGVALRDWARIEVEDKTCQTKLES